MNFTSKLCIASAYLIIAFGFGVVAGNSEHPPVEKQVRYTPVYMPIKHTKLFHETTKMLASAIPQSALEKR